jgi:predicted acyltransferase
MAVDQSTELFPPEPLPAIFLPEPHPSPHEPRPPEPMPPPKPHPEPEAPARPLSARLVSLDAFRGLTILGMLLVNNVALDTATPEPLTHAPWNGGVHFADLVFPWFVLIVGIAIPFAAAGFRRKGLPGWKYDLKLIGRTLTLVLLGCLVDSSHYQRPMFILGVLQLIGLSYFVGALLYELPLTRRLLVAAGFLIAHWAAIRFLPIPGVGAGVFTEDTNFIHHFDQAYLQPVSLRGLLSVVPLSALVLIGTALGDALRGRSDRKFRRALCVLAAGAALTAAGWLWNLDLPFNKTVWTAPYILFSAGTGALVLGGMYLLIDVAGLRFWAFPLVVFGANAMMAYVAPILVKINILDTWKWKMADGSLLPLQQAILTYCYAHAGRIRGGWFYTLGYIFIWWLVLLHLYLKRVFLRV